MSVGAERVALRSSNLRVQAAPAGPADATRFDAHSKVAIIGLSGRPQLNGQCATVLHWDDVKERYAVKLCATPRAQPSRDAGRQSRVIRACAQGLDARDTLHPRGQPRRSAPRR